MTFKRRRGKEKGCSKTITITRRPNAKGDAIEGNSDIELDSNGICHMNISARKSADETTVKMTLEIKPQRESGEDYDSYFIKKNNTTFEFIENTRNPLAIHKKVSEEYEDEVRDKDKLNTDDTKVAIATQRYGKALKQFSSKKERKGTDCAILYYNRAACSLSMHAYDKALKDAEHSVKLDSKNFEYILQKGHIELLVGNLEDSLKSFEIAKTLHLDHTEINDEVKKITDNLSFIKIGKAAAENENYELSLECFSRAYKTSYASKYILLERAELMICLDQYTELEQLIKTLNFNSLEYLYTNLIYLYHIFKNDSKGKRRILCDTLISSGFGSDPKVSKLLSTVLLVNKTRNKAAKAKANCSYGQALYFTKQALLLDKTNNGLQCSGNFDIALHYLKQEKFQLSIDHLDLAIKYFGPIKHYFTNSHLAQFYIIRNICNQSLGIKEQAKSDYEKAVELNPMILLSSLHDI